METVGSGRGRHSGRGRVDSRPKELGEHARLKSYASRLFHPLRVFFDQAFLFSERRKLLEAMRRGRTRPGELFARVRFDERDEAARVIQHGRPKVHEIKSIGLSEHPALAVRAEKVADCTVQATNDGFPFCNCKSL